MGKMLLIALPGECGTQLIDRPGLVREVLEARSGQDNASRIPGNRAPRYYPRRSSDHLGKSNQVRLRVREGLMSCCDENTARVADTDVSRRWVFKGSA
jgi:hypothetical protein